MKLSIDGKEYSVPRHLEEKLMQDLLTEAIRDYQGKLDKKLRVMAQGGARVILGILEHQAAKKDKQASLQLRPGKAEPVIFLANIFGRMLLEAMKRVHLYINCDDSGTVDTLNLAIEQGAGEARSQLDTHGSQGQRQNNGVEVP